MFNRILYGFPRSNRTWRRTWTRIHVHAEVWAPADYGSINSAADSLVIHYYSDLSGYKFMNYGNWIKSREFPTLWLAMLGCMELPIGKIRTIDKLSVYMYTSTVGFIVSVSLLCDGRLQWSSSHLSPFQGKHSKESLTVTGGFYKVWRPLSIYLFHFCTNTHTMIYYDTRKWLVWVLIDSSKISQTLNNFVCFTSIPASTYVSHT